MPISSRASCWQVDYIDEVIAILRDSKTVPEGKARLIERFKDVDMSALLDRAQYDMEGYQLEHKQGLTEEQAEAIVQMRLGQLTGMERQKVTDELYALIQKITDLLDILANRNGYTRSSWTTSTRFAGSSAMPAAHRSKQSRAKWTSRI